MKNATRLIKELRRQYINNGMGILEAHEKAIHRVDFLKESNKIKSNIRPRRDLTL